MNIKTSYYSKLRSIPEQDKTNIISISRKSINNTGRPFPELMPTSKLLWDYKQGVVNQEGYTEQYNAQLALLDPHKIAEEIGDNAILLCFEGPSKFCHRHLVAAWLNKHGYNVTEY